MFRIKVNFLSFVKVLALCGFFTFIFAKKGLTQELEFTDELDQEQTQEQGAETFDADTTELQTSGASDESTPSTNTNNFEIVARTYRLKPLRLSRSERVTLFQVKNVTPPGMNRIILLRNRFNQNIIAYRVLKRYVELGTIAAKVIKRYGNFENVEIGDRYRAIEKLIDYSALPNDSPAEKALDAKDVKELEENIPQLEKEVLDENWDDVNDDYENLAADEFVIFDPDTHWLSTHFGLFRSFNQNNDATYYRGAGVRYGITFAKKVIYWSQSVQDSFSLELAASLIPITNYSNDSGDSYTVIPITPTLRYNVAYSPGFGIFFYGGFTSTYVQASENPAPPESKNLSYTIPAFGVGLYIRFGPRWYIRADAGFDQANAGLMLRF